MAGMATKKASLREDALRLDIYAFLAAYQRPWANHDGTGARELAKVWHQARRRYATVYGDGGCFLCRRDDDG